MTPEEKLLALIQQDKRQADTAVKTPVSPPAPVLLQAAAPPLAAAPDPVPASISVPVPTPVLAVQPAPSPSQEGSRVESSPVVLSPAPEKPALSKAEVVPVEKKLKLAEPKEESRVASSAASVANPESQVTGLESRSSKPEMRTPDPVTGEPVTSEVKPEIRDLKPETASFPSAPSVLALPVFRSFGGSRIVLLNRILGVVVLVLVGIVFYSVLSIRSGIAKELEKQVNGAGSMSVAPVVVSSERAMTVDAYLDKVNTRNLFVPKITEKDGVVTRTEPAGAPKDLKLVAISMDSAAPTESMAIIKSKSDSKTYFVKQGETVGETDYVLDRVLADRIVLRQRKQEFELK